MIHNTAGRVRTYSFRDFSGEFRSSSELNNKPIECFNDYYQNAVSQVSEPVISQLDLAETGEKGLYGATDGLTETEVQQILDSAHETAEKIIADAIEQAEKIRREAESEAFKAAEAAKQTGIEAGHAIGYKEGHEEGVAAGIKDIENKNRELLDEIGRTIAELDRQKTEFIKTYADDMKDLVLSVAEKVINVNLTSNSDVILQMIMNAVESARDKQWAKIYISDHDVNLLVSEDADVLNTISMAAENVRIEIIENGKPGDLLIEYPDRAVDAGVSSQLESIRNALNDIED